MGDILAWSGVAALWVTAVTLCWIGRSLERIADLMDRKR